MLLPWFSLLWKVWTLQAKHGQNTPMFPKEHGLLVLFMVVLFQVKLDLAAHEKHGQETKWKHDCACSFFLETVLFVFYFFWKIFLIWGFSCTFGLAPESSRFFLSSVLWLSSIVRTHCFLSFFLFGSLLLDCSLFGFVLLACLFELYFAEVSVYDPIVCCPILSLVSFVFLVFS